MSSLLANRIFAVPVTAAIKRHTHHTRTRMIYTFASSLTDEAILNDMETIGEQLRGLGSGEVHIDVDSNPDVAVVKLCNLKRKNALSGKMMAELGEAVRPGGVLANFKGSCLVLHGDGGMDAHARTRSSRVGNFLGRDSGF